MEEGRLLEHRAAKGAQAAGQRELQAPQRLQRRHALLRAAATAQPEQEHVLEHCHRVQLPLTLRMLLRLLLQLLLLWSAVARRRCCRCYRCC